MRADRFVQVITTVVAAFMFGGALYMTNLAAKLPKGLGPGALGPKTFPLFVLYATAVGSLLLGGWTVFRMFKPAKTAAGSATGSSGEGATGDGEDGEEEPAAAQIETRPFRRIVGVAAGFTVLVAVWHALGFVVASALFIAATSFFLGEPGARTAKSAGASVLWAVGFTAVIWLVFVKLLNVPLPIGTFIDR